LFNMALRTDADGDREGIGIATRGERIGSRIGRRADAQIAERPIPRGLCSTERGTGLPSLSPHPFPSLRPPASASLRIVSLDEAEHFSHNQKASVATLR